ncbi:MAG TPA: glycosyltransferase family 39 protein, partial [Chloroflexia bacterium]|nr:glycosyltransferase family 39 protein [Chloroflexia bacterium]
MRRDLAVKTAMLRMRGPLGRLARHPGVSLALIAWWLGVLWVAAIAPLNSPDEPAHLLTVMQVRVAHILPEVHYDFSQDPAGQIVNTPVDQATIAYGLSLGHGDNPIKLMPYESIQPPLYYLAAALASLALPPTPEAVLYASRLVAALFGAGAVYFCWAATRQLAPRAPRWAVGVAGVVALLPQFCFNSASASNDSALNCLAAAAFYVWFRGLRHPAYDPSMLRAGAVVGLAILAKSSALVLVPGLALVWLFRSWNGPHGPTVRAAALNRAARLAAGAAGATLAVCGWWFLRNLLI